LKLHDYLLTLVSAVFMFGSLPTQAAQGQEVHFPSADGSTLLAWLFMPQRAPLGTVIALHGCGGLYASSGARQGELNARHQAMADMLLEQGYAVLFPDSLTPRGVRELCSQKIGARNIDQTERRHDALAALEWVARQSWANPRKLALLGWSHGGSAVLSATHQGHKQVAAHAAKPVVAIAFYPGCSAARKAGYQPNTRLLLLLGEKDDWTAPGPCQTLGREVGAQVHVFADSYHDFDNPVGSVKLRKDVPNGVYPGEGVHAGANPAARSLAYALLRAELKAAFE
jgi:dienelactone hydrolase